MLCLDKKNRVEIQDFKDWKAGVYLIEAGCGMGKNYFVFKLCCNLHFCKQRYILCCTLHCFVKENNFLLDYARLPVVCRGLFASWYVRWYYLIYKGRMQELQQEGQSVFKKVRFGEQSHTCSKERKKQEVHCA